MQTKITISRPKFTGTEHQTKKQVTVTQGKKQVKFPASPYLSNKLIRDSIIHSNLRIV